MLRKAVITGATKGIGRAIAESLATEGYDIAVCSRHEEDLLEMQKEFTSRFENVELITKVADMSKKEEVLQFAQFIDSQWQRVDAKTSPFLLISTTLVMSSTFAKRDANSFCISTKSSSWRLQTAISYPSVARLSADRRAHV